MKQKIRIIGFDGKITEEEKEIPNKFHLEVQKTTRANIFKPKKGKGSYSRKSKHSQNLSRDV